LDLAHVTINTTTMMINLPLLKYFFFCLFVLVFRQAQGFAPTQKQQQQQQQPWNAVSTTTTSNSHHHHRAVVIDTRRFSSSASSDDDFMASLRTRVQEVNDGLTKLPLVVLDSMLPRQVLKIQANNLLLMELVGNRITNRRNPSCGKTVGTSFLGALINPLPGPGS
jgi:hypothetical protein